MKLKFALAALLGCSTSIAFAASVDITVGDGVGSSYQFGTDSRGIHEDQETEMNTVGSQAWDLEAFVVKGSKLYIIGGFDFKHGVSGYPDYSSGDIFVDNNSNARWGANAYHPGGGDGYINYGNSHSLYNYAIRFNFGTGKFQVYSLAENDTTQLTTSYYRQNDSSNPWKYASGGTAVNLANDSLYYSSSAQTDAQIATDYGVNLLGGTHYVVGVDMSWYNGTGIETHFTMGCGNDDIEGQMQGGFDVPDGGTTAILLGLGLSAMALVRGPKWQKSSIRI